MLQPNAMILAIESSCDDTAAAILRNDRVLSNIVSSQVIHKLYGGVVPELASREHQRNIVPVVQMALDTAGITVKDLDAVAFTRGPGLMGSLLVGVSFAKAFALASGIPLIEVNHMEAHVLANFIRDQDEQPVPSFPFLCLTVSGGHTQIIKVSSHREMKLLGETIDDAAGEAFDKGAKLMGLPYPGGPLIDKFAADGDPERFKFPVPSVDELNFSFSGLKTSLLYFLENNVKKDPDFVEKNKADICASYQGTIIRILTDKLIKAAKSTGIKDIAIAGGVSANKGLRKALAETSETQGWKLFVPEFRYCTDNAAMIGIAGYYKYLQNDFASQDIAPLARYVI